jgi:hypothetical protein
MREFGALFVASILAASLQACAAPQVEAEDIAVWNAVVTSFCRDEFPAKTVISLDPIDVMASQHDGPLVNKEAWTNLKARSAVHARLPSNLGCDGLRAVRETSLQHAFDKSSAIPPKWDGFYQQFPGADSIVRLSLPGFTPDKTVAVVLESTSACDGFCSFGNYFHLKGIGDVWTIAEVETAWIS